MLRTRKIITSKTEFSSRVYLWKLFQAGTALPMSWNSIEHYLKCIDETQPADFQLSVREFFAICLRKIIFLAMESAVLAILARLDKFTGGHYPDCLHAPAARIPKRLY
ncbi:hypothetical protein [Noviherbaspirillum sp.]|uniref:hypothetical protein n=1 Tax=Noviherbaspirillum sp. TaxID=1926288 RepID=UPI002FE361A5